MKDFVKYKADLNQQVLTEMNNQSDRLVTLEN